MGILEFLFHRGNDLTTQFLPDALFFRDSILAGKFPFWNPWIFAGMPYLLDPQNFLWYPPNYLLLLFRSVEFGFLVLLVGHLILAGHFVKKILFDLPRWFQFLGIFLFLFSPKLVSHFEEGNWTLVIAATWLPALYWALINQRFWWTVVSLSALIINNLNIGYYATLFVLLWFFVQFLHKSIGDRESIYVISRNFRNFSAQFFRKTPSDRVPFFGNAFRESRVFRLFLFVTVFTLPRWLPLVLWGDQTVRASLSEPPLPFWSWTKIAKSLFIPFAPGHPQLQNEEILYMGLITTLFLVWKIWKDLILPLRKDQILNPQKFAWKGLSLRTQRQSLRNAFKRFWMIWLVFVFLVTFNVKTPLFPLIQLLPGFSLLRITTRPWIFVSLFVALVTPIALFQLSKRSKLLAVIGVLGILGEFGIFGYKLFDRRAVQADPLPRRFYERMIQEGIPARAYCTTGCIDRLTAQKMGIALLHGNNPIQLKEFVTYLQEAGGYRESSYHPILPPYTVFNQQAQPNAAFLGKTATQFVISPYKLDDPRLLLLDQIGDWRLYENQSDATPYRDHFFELQKRI